MADTIEKNVTRGGQFLVKETKCEDIFTPEDFSEEQSLYEKKKHKIRSKHHDKYSSNNLDEEHE